MCDSVVGLDGSMYRQQGIDEWMDAGLAGFVDGEMWLGVVRWLDIDSCRCWMERAMNQIDIFAYIYMSSVHSVEDK